MSATKRHLCETSGSARNFSHCIGRTCLVFFSQWGQSEDIKLTADDVNFFFFIQYLIFSMLLNFCFKMSCFIAPHCYCKLCAMAWLDKIVALMDSIKRNNKREYFLCLYNLIESLAPLCFFYKSKRWHILAVMWNTERVLNEWGDKLSRQLGSTITSSSLQSLSCTCTDWPARLVDILCSRLHLRLDFQECHWFTVLLKTSLKI